MTLKLSIHGNVVNKFQAVDITAISYLVGDDATHRPVLILHLHFFGISPPYLSKDHRVYFKSSIVNSVSPKPKSFAF